jgi:SulP family sulfate permease
VAGRYLIDRRTIGSDAVAGVTLGIESIPDAMASGVLAGVNPIYGLYAVMLATPVGALFAGSVFMSVQTTGAMSALVADVSAVHGGGDADRALFTLALITGVLMAALGLLRLGSLLSFVPNAVLTGFINGVAILIILGQLGNLTGYSAEGSNKVTQTIDLALHVNSVNLPTVFVGVATILLIVTLTATRLRSFGLVAALIMASVLVPLFSWDSVRLVQDVADIPGSLPTPVLPSLKAIPALLVPAVSLAFVGVVQGAGISKSVTNPDHEYPDASRDFVGQGAANIAAGIFQGMPVGGSLSATALVTGAGAKTRLANLVAGGTMAVMLLLFAGAVGRLAMPALAGLLIVIGFQTLKPHDLRLVWNTGMVQRTVMVVTFALTLVLPLQYAVLSGIGLSVILYVFRQSNKVVVKQWVLAEDALPKEQDPPAMLPPGEVVVLVPYGSLFFAATSTVEQQLPEVTAETRNAAVVLLLRGRTDLGSTFLGMLDRYRVKLLEHDSSLMLAEVGDVAQKQLAQTGFLRAFGRENVFGRTESVGESALEAAEEAARRIEEASHRTREAERSSDEAARRTLE